MKNFEKLKKQLRWFEAQLKKELDEIIGSSYAEEYAYQKRDSALKLYEVLVCVDAIRVKVDMKMTGRGVHRITKPPEIRVVKKNEPGYWRGENREEAIYFYHLVVDK